MAAHSAPAGDKAAGAPRPAPPDQEGAKLTPGEEAELAAARDDYTAGRFDAALAKYDRLVADFPQRAVFWNDRGVSLDAVARHGEAEGAYKRALELYPEYELAYRNLSNCLVFQGREGEALGALTKAVRAEPAYEEAYRDALSIMMARGPGSSDVEAARDILRVAGTAFARYLLGVVAAEAGDTRQAVRELRTALQSLRSDPAETGGDPERQKTIVAEVEKALGNALFARDELPDAVDAYRRSVDANAKDEEAWNNLGFAYYTANENDAAIECFERAVAVNPQYKHAWYNLAYAFQTIDMLEEAIKAYDKTLGCDPLDEVAWNNRGNAEYNLGRYEASIPFFERAVEIQPDYDIAWNNIGNALNKAGRHAEAVPFHERALTCNPAFDYAWYALAKSRFHIGDLEGAVRDIGRCIEVNRQFDSGWVMKAEILLHLGDAEEALEAAEQSVALNPANDHAHFVHAEVLEAMGRREAAEAAYERAITVAGEAAVIRERVPDAWTAHGEMLLQQDRVPEALSSFAKGAAINPASVMAREGTLEGLLRVGKYREALSSMPTAGAREAPHEGVVRMRLYMETGDFGAVIAAAARHLQWHGDEAEVRLLEGEAYLALDQPAEARAVLGKAVALIERQLAKEREARSGAASARRGGRRLGRSSKDGGKRDKEEWVDVQDGRRKIKALQEEGAFLDSFAEEPSGEEALLGQMYWAKLLSARVARAVGQPDEARALLADASAARGDRDEAWGELGEIEMDAKDYKAARAAFERAVGADGVSDRGWAGLMAVAEAEGDGRRLEALRRARPPRGA